MVGKKVMAAAAETLTPVTLELGGKDPVIFCEDVNVEEVRPWLVLRTRMGRSRLVSRSRRGGSRRVCRLRRAGPSRMV